jgi:nucleoside-diphosphate-sugar epimerase
MQSQQISTLSELDDELSRPSNADCNFIESLQGDIAVLGAGGKIGPSLVRLLARANQKTGARKRIFAVSRSGAAMSEDFSGQVEILRCDLLEQKDVSTLPKVENVLYLAGRKFGSSERPDLTWASNCIIPVFVARHFRESRIVVYSTGNVYPFREISAGGSLETDALQPVGEYAQSCVARERIFEFHSNEYGTPCLLFRLNYAVDLRYGVLVDVAERVFNGQPVDLTVPVVNVIWQRDANSYALRSLELCSSPARALNVTGREMVFVRNAAEFFGKRFGRACHFTGEGRTALLSDASACYESLGPPELPLETMMQWIAHWIESGGYRLNKPTHFEVHDGRF